MDDEYACVSKSSLKLKCPAFKKKKKKSKDSKEKAELKAQTMSEVANQESDAPAPASDSGLQLTKAEKSFLQMQEKRQTSRILEKARKSHKKRVEEFNNHLDSLSEHYDIPKVSWTK